MSKRWGFPRKLTTWFLFGLLFGCGGPEPFAGAKVEGAVLLLDLFPQARKTTNAGEQQEYIYIRWANLEGKKERVLFLHPTSEIAFRLRLERPAVLETAIGLLPEAWERQTDGVIFYITIRKEGEFVPTYLLQRYLSRELAQEFSGWWPVLIDLTPYRDANIELVFGTHPGPEDNPLYDWAVWRDPRIYNPADEEQRSPESARKGGETR